MTIELSAPPIRHYGIDYEELFQRVEPLQEAAGVLYIARRTTHMNDPVYRDAELLEEAVDCQFLTEGSAIHAKKAPSVLEVLLGISSADNEIVFGYSLELRDTREGSDGLYRTPVSFYTKR